MRKNLDRNIDSELSEYFNQARAMRCPPDMKRKLYQRLDMERRSYWLPAAAFALVCVITLGLMMPAQRQAVVPTETLTASEFDYAEANKDMQIAMHYMEKIGLKTLTDANAHGIMPGIIMPVSKTVSQI